MATMPAMAHPQRSFQRDVQSDHRRCTAVRLHYQCDHDCRLRRFHRQLCINESDCFYIGYFILAIAGTFMVRKSDNPVVSFIGYNLMAVPIGMVIAVSVTLYSAIGYNMIVAAAFGITAAVTLVMMIISSIYPNFFLSMGRTLGITLLITVVVEAIMLIAGASLGIIDYVVVAIFCLYVGYDWAKANAIEKTVDNAIDSASELYLDIVNLFLRIMKILARANRN